MNKYEVLVHTTSNPFIVEAERVERNGISVDFYVNGETVAIIPLTSCLYVNKIIK